MGANVTSMILVDVSITAALLMAWRIVGYFIALRRRPGGDGGGGGGHGPEEPLAPPGGPGGRARSCRPRRGWQGARPRRYCLCGTRAEVSAPAKVSDQP